MEKAVELLVLLPKWFYFSLLQPFWFGPFSGFPALSMICLVAGLVLGIIRRQARLLLFLIPIAMSQALVAAMEVVGESGFWGVDRLIYSCFLVLQIALSAYLVYHARNAMPAALALAAFSIVYAFVATIIASTAYHFPAI